MSARAYDVVLTVDDASGFQSTNSIIGVTTGTTGIIANVDTSTNQLKVKLNNLQQEFSSSEDIQSNTISTQTVIEADNYYFDITNAEVQSDNQNRVLITTRHPHSIPSSAIDANPTFGNTLIPAPTTVTISDVGGMTEINGSKLVVGVGRRTVALAEILVSNAAGTSYGYTDGSGYSAYTSGGKLVTPSLEGDGLLTTANTYLSNVYAGNVTTATATISSIAQSAFKAEKNAFTQNPVVRLYSIYYPGEWYPPNKSGNPTGQGAGRAWPVDFPIRFAEIVGDLTSDILYNVSYGGTSFIPFPVNSSTISQGSEGAIEEVTIDIFNVDNIITRLVEDPFITGNNSSNSVVALVNGEFVHGIDPRTVDADPSDVGSVGDEAFDSLTRARANGLSFSQSIINSTYGKANASFTRTETLSVGGTWTEQKSDSRDLLGGIVEIQTTFANFLDYWPEYSSVQSVNSNVIEVYNTLPYRVGDNVKSSTGDTEATIQSIERNSFLFLSNELDANTSFGSAIYIINSEADSESYIEDRFKIDQLEKLNDSVATFNLISWLQYFKLQTPKRKYYKNTCQWTYKGAECQYPGPAGGTIPGTSLSANSNPIAANNQIASDASGDVCGKSILSCTLRNNQIHFGGFPSTGRTIPRV
jgi:phage-related protein